MKRYLFTMTISIVLTLLFTGCDSNVDTAATNSSEIVKETAFTTTSSVTTTETTSTTTTTTSTITTTETTSVITTQEVYLLPEWRTKNLKAGTVVVKDPYNPGKWLFALAGVQVCHTYGESCIIESLNLYGGHTTIVTVGFTDYEYYGENVSKGIEHVPPSKYCDLNLYIDSYAENMVSDGWYVLDPEIEIYDATRKLVLHDYGVTAALYVAPTAAAIVWENASGIHEYILYQGDTLKLYDPGYGMEVQFPKVDAAVQNAIQNTT